MADQMLSARQVAAALRNAGTQSSLHRVREVIVLAADLRVEGDQLFGELLRDTGAEVLLRKALRAARPVRPPQVDREVRETRIDVDRHVGKQQVILGLRNLTP